MIEIEKKFILSDEERERLLDGAEFAGERMQHDVYFDDEAYSLTRANKFFRRRNNRWELKIGVEHDFDLDVTHYRELETEDEILTELGITHHRTMEEDVAAEGLTPCAEYCVTRCSYLKGRFRIDHDVTDFGYEMVEIELLIEDGANRAAAEILILDFARSHGIEIKYIRGKLLEYLRRNNLDHFQALVKAGVTR